MKRMPDRIEAQCPRCGAAFVIVSMSRRRKIQCPKCRQTVAVAQAEQPADAEPDEDPSEPVANRVTNFDAVPEPTPATSLVELFPEPSAVPAPTDSLLCAGQQLRWLRRDPSSGCVENEDGEQREVLLHNLRAMGRRQIVIESVLDDKESRPLAEQLSATFREAGWSVFAAQPSARKQRATGLIIAAGQCPLPRAATATYMALKAAGFPITSRLDSALGPEQSVLIAHSPSENPAC